MRTALVSLALVVSGLAWAQPAAPVKAPPPITVLKAARMFDARAGKIVTPGVVVVQGPKILGVGAKAAAGPFTEKVTTLDLGDATLLPGFLDSHCHLTGEPSDDWKQDFIDGLRETPVEEALHSLDNLKRTLHAGFTTCRNLGAAELVDVALRNGVAKGYIVGPRMVVSTWGLGTTGGHCDSTNGFPPGLLHDVVGKGVANSPEEFRALVRRNIKVGADVIKVCATGGVLSRNADVDSPQLTQAELDAIVDEAHARKRKAAAHAHGAEGARRAVKAGIDSIEHGSFLDDATLAEMKRRGTFYVPTALALKDLGDQYAKGNLHPDAVPKYLAASKSHDRALRSAIKMGVRIAYGTDSGVYRHGRNAEEFKMLVAAGMKPAAALQAATVNAAELFGLEGEIGALEPGKAADVIAVPGDPTVDISLTEKVFFVMRAGVVYKDQRAK
jgi:imidazolonepropionase-like amidohydrolase